MSTLADQGSNFASSSSDSEPELDSEAKALAARSHVVKAEHRRSYVC